MRTARSATFALQPRLLRCSYATEPTPAPEAKPASQPEPKPAPEAVKPVADGAAAEGASVLKAQASEDPSAKADTGAKKDGAETPKPAPAPASPASGVWAYITENRGIIWMILFLNFIIWLNSFMLDTAEAKIAESLDFALSDDERLFAWNSLKMLSQFQPPHADKRYINNVRGVIFDGVADDEPIIKEAALSVLTALMQTNEKVQRQVMKDLEQIGFENLWERMALVLIRTPPRPTTLGAAPGAQDPLIARIRYRFTTMFAFLAANRENHSTLLRSDYVGPLMQMMDATAGSSNLLDRLARQDIAGTFFSLTALEESRAALLMPAIVTALVKLKEEGPDNAPGTRSLAAKTLVNLAQMNETKDMAVFPKLTPRDYELAKMEVEQESDQERQSFWQWWRPSEQDSATSKVLNFVKPIGFVASVAWVYGALRTANYRKSQWRNSANWRNALTMGGAKATAGALSLMGMSMAFDTLISTPLEKKFHINPAHAEMTFFVLAIPTLTRKLPYCLAPVMGSAVYEIYQNYTEDFVPEQMETANDLMDTTMLTMQLKDRIEKTHREEAELRAAAAARARAEMSKGASAPAPAAGAGKV